MKQKKTIIIADDQASMRKNLSDLLTEEGLRVVEAADGQAAVSAVRTQQPSLILLDINMPRLDGMAALEEIKKSHPEVPVIMFTAYGTSERAIEAMKAGAYDYMEKPFELDDFLLTVRRALNYSDLIGEVRQLRSKVTSSMTVGDRGDLIGSNGRMQDIFKTVGRIAPTDATVLIQGESGTGKELVADAIQRHSLRASRAFIKVNCGALPETLLETEMFGHEKGAFTGAVAQRTGRFELANGGTIFLDEVNNMPPALQMKLLRVLQHKTYERVGGKETLSVDVRVIAATNKDLELEMKTGQFREDLFYRLNVIHISLPPLREHPEDIPILVDHFLTRYAPDRTMAMGPGVLDHLRGYSWPGNIRELENSIQRAVVLAQSDLITLEHFPPHIRSVQTPQTGLPQMGKGRGFKEAINEVERRLIIEALDQTGWNRSKAADLLKINRRLLFSKILQHRISQEKT